MNLLLPKKLENNASRDTEIAFSVPKIVGVQVIELHHANREPAANVVVISATKIQTSADATETRAEGDPLACPPVHEADESCALRHTKRELWTDRDIVKILVRAKICAGVRHYPQLVINAVAGGNVGAVQVRFVGKL